MNLVLQFSAIAAVLQVAALPGPVSTVPAVIESSLAFAGWAEGSDSYPNELRIVLKFSSFAEQFAKFGVDLEPSELMESLEDDSSVELSEVTPWCVGESCPPDGRSVIWIRIVDMERVPTGYRVRVWYHFPQEHTRSEAVVSGFAGFGLSLTWADEDWNYERIGRHYRS